MPAHPSETATIIGLGTGAEALLQIALDRSWGFIDKDPFLAHNSKPFLRDQLKMHLEQAVRDGERDLLTIANNAINRLRADFGLQ